jgi:hypothetical protein
MGLATAVSIQLDPSHPSPNIIQLACPNYTPISTYLPTDVLQPQDRLLDLQNHISILNNLFTNVPQMQHTSLLLFHTHIGTYVPCTYQSTYHVLLHMSKVQCFWPFLLTWKTKMMVYSSMHVFDNVSINGWNNWHRTINCHLPSTPHPTFYHLLPHLPCCLKGSQVAQNLGEYNL